MYIKTGPKKNVKNFDDQIFRMRKKKSSTFLGPKGPDLSIEFGT